MSTGDIHQDAAENSFWEIKQYMRTVKRVENANKLCGDLSQMIQERAAIENAYADNLKKWSNRWSTMVKSGIEYNTGANAWLSVCNEADNLSQMHKTVHDCLINEIQAGVRKWHKERFHKSALPPQSIKEAKVFEQDFESAQKPWNKRLKKVNMSKKDYYHACKAVRSLRVQAENAKNDPSGAPEQRELKLKKIQEKLKRAEKDEERTKAVYENSLADLDSEKPRYLEEMATVFERTQAFETTRLEFFKDVFFSLHQTLDLSDKSELPRIYANFKKTIELSNPSEDTAFWSTNHGVDMPANFPVFEEYSPELAAISKKKGGFEHTGSVRLTGIQQLGSPTTTNNMQSAPEANQPHYSYGADQTADFISKLRRNFSRLSIRKAPPKPSKPPSRRPSEGSQKCEAKAASPYDTKLNPFGVDSDSGDEKKQTPDEPPKDISVENISQTINTTQETIEQDQNATTDEIVEKAPLVSESPNPKIPENIPRSSVASTNEENSVMQKSNLSELDKSKNESISVADVSRESIEIPESPKAKPVPDVNQDADAVANKNEVESVSNREESELKENLESPKISTKTDDKHDASDEENQVECQSTEPTPKNPEPAMKEHQENIDSLQQITTSDINHAENVDP